MSTNISGEKRQALLSKIAEIKSFIEQNSNDKNASQLISYLGDLTREVNGKKYGLVFEEHREAIDEKLEQNAPVFTEEKDLFIDNGGELNFLLEGDNLASLKLLEKTHRGKIDVIYIDPPYNTGKEDFCYDDNYVDVTDSYRHSKWLSFMENRLKIAKEILKKDGVIFISIDDNEMAVLKVLCDEIFGLHGFINNFMWLHGKGKKNKQTRTLQQYILGYCKIDRDVLPAWNLVRGAKGNFSNPDNDPRGEWFSGSISFSEERSNKNHANYFTIKSPSGIEWTRQWQCSREEMDQYLNENKIYFGLAPEYNNTPRIKIFPDDTYEVIPDNICPNVGTSRSAQKDLDDIIDKKLNEKGKLVSKFDNPKPVDLINHLISICSGENQNITILDFFAGSGTTGHAVLKLNAEDGGHRKFILCTNNENNICREITYQRLKTVITGTRKDGSKYSDGLPGSLKYFKTDFIPISEKMYYEYADDLLLHVRELVELENAVNFDKDKTVAIVLDDDEMEEFIATLVESGRNEQKDTSTGLSVRNTGLSVRSTGLSVRALYVGHDVLVSGKQERILKSHNISINTIPDYYYRDLAL